MAVEFKDNQDLPNIIELRNISQSYDGGKSYIIKDLNLLIEDKPMQGQFIGLLGMSGCGKSTLLRFLAGLQKPTSGEVFIEDKPIGKENNVSMVFQRYSSLPWMSVLDNVALALRYKGVAKSERNDRAMEIIKKVGLDGHEKKFAQYPNLSGGQLQRVAIARSIISNPKILLMDEPFGALDVKTRLQMQDLLIKIWEEYKPTIVFITHDIEEAVYLSDDIYIMGHAPSNINQHVYVDLPFNRNRLIKRDPHFNEIVHDVEDKMMQLAGGENW